MQKDFLRPAQIAASRAIAGLDRQLIVDRREGAPVPLLPTRKTI